MKNGLFLMGLFEKKEPKSYEVAGRLLHCVICGHDRFWRRGAQLNTATATFFDMDWANETANCFVCEGCGYIHWFLPK
jgi:hypothetical protein